MEVTKADLTVEAALPRPEFTLFRDAAALLDCLYRRLEPYGLRLTDIRVERGAGNVGEQHFLLYLFNYWMTVRIRVERVEVYCSDLPPGQFDRFKAAMLDVLGAVKDHRPDLSFRTFGIALEIHARLEGQPVRDYLARFATNNPTGLGPPSGSGVVFYFGPEGDRLLSAITADVSAVVSEGLYLRIHGVWDAGRVAPDALGGIAEGFVRQAIEGFGLQLPA